MNNEDYALIDDFLEVFAIETKGTFTKDRNDYPNVLQAPKDRRIDWVDLMNQNIKKAIIIYESKCGQKINIESAIWMTYEPSNVRRNLVHKDEDFDKISNNINCIIKELYNKISDISI